MKKIILALTTVTIVVINVVAFVKIAGDDYSVYLNSELEALMDTETGAGECGQDMGRCDDGHIGLMCTFNTGGWDCRHRDCGSCL